MFTVGVAPGETAETANGSATKTYLSRIHRDNTGKLTMKIIHAMADVHGYFGGRGSATPRISSSKQRIFMVNFPIRLLVP
jgi:hypothetical protein